MPCGGGTPANDVQRHVEGVDQTGEAKTQGAAYSFIDDQRAFITFLGEPGYIERGYGCAAIDQVARTRGATFIRSFPRHAGDAGGRGEQLKATAIAARAQDAVRPHGDVACLTGHAAGTMPDFAVEDQAATYTGAQRQHA